MNENMTNNENVTKMCRFCLYEENCDNTNKVLGIFQGDLDADLAEKIRSYTQIMISPDDKIPSNICMNCVDSIVKFDKFLDCCWKSENVLREIYDVPNETNRDINSDRSKSHISDENVLEHISENNEKLASSDNDINSSKIGDIPSDDFVDDSDSDASTIKEKKIATETKNVKNANLHTLNESMRKIIGNNTYICSICSKQFRSFFEYQDHQDTHNGQFVFSCTKCDKVFSERMQLVEHDANHKVACQVCNKMVLPKSLTAHLKKHTDLHRCPHCNLCHTSDASLEKHIKARHKGQKGLVCHFCGKQSSCQSSLNRHLAYHSSATPHQCTFCSFSTKTRGILKVHTSRKHLNVPRPCEHCGKIFKSEISLEQHMKRIHNPRKYICHICQKAFIEKYSLEKHVLRKHSKNHLHECKTCHKEFSTTRELKEHMHSHRQGCVTCPNCGKQFFYKKYLERHLAKCGPDLQGDNFKNKLCRFKSTISLPGSSMNVEK